MSSNTRRNSLAQTALTVVFGTLADIYGRKPIMLWGIGAGAMQPVAMIMVADLYPARERGKVQGYLASVWAISAVLGPIVGGLIIRNVSWSWIFWINIPVGFIAVTSLLIGLTEIGNSNPAVLAMAAVAGAMAFMVPAVELKQATPVAVAGDAASIQGSVPQRGRATTGESWERK